ncbi:4Fe-4S dicluster domain-containing protein [Lachnospiraceae bacterium 56-18]
MRILDNMEACYGCGACFNVCSTEAIDMRENEEGFLEPVIDGDKCIYGVWFSIIFA